MRFIGRSFVAFSILILGSVSSISCQKSERLKGEGSELAAGLTAQQLLNSHQVVNGEGQPIANAQVLIGYGVGDPFRGNELRTNAQGSFSVPAAWTAQLPVTVEAEGYIKATFDRVAPRARTYKMSARELDAPITLQGEARGFTGLRTDGWVDFALVLPTFKKSDLLGFELSQVVSPETDRITIVGNNVDIPSNISLPRQRENYIIPITLDKPRFRTQVRRLGENEFVATHAQFPFRETVDHIRGGGSIFDVIKDFRFVGAGIQSADVGQQNPRLNISVNQIRFDSEIEVRAPEINNQNMVFALGLINREGRYLPTDIKYLESNQSLKLKTTQGQGAVFKAALLTNKADGVVSQDQLDQIFKSEIEPQQVMQELFEAATDTSALQQMSIALQTGSDASAFRFLPLVEAPFVRGVGVLLKPPQASSGLTPLSTRLILSEVERLKSGEIESERRTRLWEIIAPGWVTSIELPNHEIVKKPNRVYRWEVIYLAHSGTASSADDIEAATHISRNAINF